MKSPVAIISMLHEGPIHNSATRLFRGEPVLAATLRRLSQITGIESAFILCWDDQSPAVENRSTGVSPVFNSLTHERNAQAAGGEVRGATATTIVTAPAQNRVVNIACKGRRHSVPNLDAVAASARWMDGWRGGLLQTCDFDAGFHAGWIMELVGDADALLIDPAAGLLDPTLVDAVLDRAQARPDLDMIFSQAPPGMSGVIVRNSLLIQLAATHQHPGKLLHYIPQRPSRDPISTEACVEVPTELARSAHHLKLNSRRQIDRLENANTSDAKPQFSQFNSAIPSSVPREVVLELTTRRSTFPAFGAARHFPLNRPDLSVDLARILFHEIGSVDDLRLTLAGVGDPLCHPAFFEIVECARATGVPAIHIETDLHDLDSAQVAGLVEAGIDIVSVNLPAITAETYTNLMGIDGYERVVNNIKQLLLRRQGLSRGTPIVVPTFVKCRENLAEMESWYDQWLRALGVAVITGPTDCAGQIPEIAVADMTPPNRKPCSRLNHRMMILSDGRIVSCEQDIFGRQVMGEVGRDSIADVWAGSFESLRADHRQSKWQHHPLCASCKEWHRP